jgi:endonuclease/exonuclease/phosphatase family metal-dependent hydrolase
MKKTISTLSVCFVCLTIGLILSSVGCARKNNTTTVVITTWNLRGYPEKEQSSMQWFHQELTKLKPDVFCVQEIANQDDVNQLLSSEQRFTKVAFNDSSDGQDNAIFCTSSIDMEDIPDPCGFQHPAQAAYVSYGGFDAVIVTIHLSWTNMEMREKEKALLRNVVVEMLKKDPDVIIVGDFNTEEKDIQELAQSIGMQVMVPAGQDGIGTTHAGHRYDHFLISPDLVNEEAISCHINTFSGTDLETAKKVSDHLSVSAVFRTDSQFRGRK